jgi:hypothetical protein
LADDVDQIVGRISADRRGVRCVEPVGGKHQMPSAMDVGGVGRVRYGEVGPAAPQVWAIPSANWRIGKTCDRENMPNG